MALTGKNVRVRGKWWHYQFEAQGQPISGSTGLAGVPSNQNAAEVFAEAKRREYLSGISPEDPGSKPFDEAAGEFITWCRDVQYRAKPATAARIAGSFTSLVILFGNRPVSLLDAAALEEYKTFRVQQGCRDVTIRHDLHALSVFFQYGQRMKWAHSNPVREVKIPSDREAVREHVITVKEEAAYFKAAEGLHKGHLVTHPAALPNMPDLARLMLQQGARPEELLAARKEHYDAELGTLLIAGGKTKAARRLLSVTAVSAKILDRRMKLAGPWLFPSDRRPGHHLTQLQATHDRICRDAGVSFVIYDFRHTFATRMVQEAKVDIPTLAAILGHSSLRTISRYVHPTQEHQAKAMERYEAAQKRRRLKVVG